MKKVIAIITVICLNATAAFAGGISQIFSDSVFGVKWSESIEEVRKKFPEGKETSLFSGAVRNYSVKDGREIMLVKRREKDKITFSFSQGRLTHIGIEFDPDTEVYGAILSQMQSSFGAYETLPASKSFGGLILNWPVDDGVAVRLMQYPSGFAGNALILEISKTGTEGLDKARFGF
ncbi:MAG TPA: hypothetical protein VN367_10560 [Chlorobaculum sp.]|nr:hypothetical protein [Chlorobaculum sp.]